MATAEEILAAANGVDGQSVLVIDNDLRVIAIPDDVKLLGVESDDDVRRLHFSMPRQYGEVDLSGFAVRINYINANSEGDVYTVGDAQTDGDRITFSWLIGRHAARYAGNVQFIVCLKRFEGGEVVQEYNTTVAALPVLKGLETDEAVARENPDVIEDILLRLSALEQGGGAGGEDGGYYVPHVDAAGNLSWTASKEGMPGVAGANIKGAKGDKGDPGEDYVLTESDKAEIAGMVEVTLPIAGADTLGGVKPVAKTGGMTQEVGVDADGGLWTMAGGAGGEADTQFRLIRTVVIPEPEDIPADTSGVAFAEQTNGGILFAFDTDKDGQPFELSEIIIVSYAGTEHSSSSFNLGVGSTPVYALNAIATNLTIGKSGNKAYSWSHSIIHTDDYTHGFGVCFGGGSFNNVQSSAKRQRAYGMNANHKATSLRAWMGNLSGYGFMPGSEFAFYGR